MSLSPDQILRLRARLEIPDCPCKVRFAPLCIFTHGAQGCTPKCIRPKRPEGCETRTRTGKCGCRRASCECPRWPIDPPCKHILALADSWPAMFTFDNWIDWLESIPPQVLGGEDQVDQVEEGYRAGRPTTPDAAVTRPQRVELLAQRHAWREQLWHPADVLPEHEVMMDTEIKGERLRNGRDRILGLFSRLGRAAA